MNKVMLCGRLARDVETRYSNGSESIAISRYTLAVDRKIKKGQSGGEPSADFINCVALGKSGEFAEKYFTKGLRVLVSGRIQTGSYTNRDGKKVYTTEVFVEEQEFADGKNSSHKIQENQDPGPSPYGPIDSSGFMTIPEGMDEDLPFA